MEKSRNRKGKRPPRPHSIWQPWNVPKVTGRTLQDKTAWRPEPHDSPNSLTRLGTQEGLCCWSSAEARGPPQAPLSHLRRLSLQRCGAGGPPCLERLKAPRGRMCSLKDGRTLRVETGLRNNDCCCVNMCRTAVIYTGLLIPHRAP